MRQTGLHSEDGWLSVRLSMHNWQMLPGSGPAHFRARTIMWQATVSTDDAHNNQRFRAGTMTKYVSLFVCGCCGWMRFNGRRLSQSQRHTRRGQEGRPAFVTGVKSMRKEMGGEVTTLHWARISSIYIMTSLMWHVVTLAEWRTVPTGVFFCRVQCSCCVYVICVPLRCEWKIPRTNCVDDSAGERETMTSFGNEYKRRRRRRRKRRRHAN